MTIDVNSIVRTVEVDNRISLHYYYRIADNLLRQANVYREENNVVDLYIILLRFSSLASETIPLHRDYPNLRSREKTIYKKKLLEVLDELELLKPEFHRRVQELNQAQSGVQLVELGDEEGPTYSSRTGIAEGAFKSATPYLSLQKRPADAVSLPWTYRNDSSELSSSMPTPLDKQFQKLSLSLPVPKKETLSRHTLLGPNGLQGQWLGPSAGIKVQYPSSKEFSPVESSSINQTGSYDVVAVEDAGYSSTMESILSLDDGRWSRPAAPSSDALTAEMMDDPFRFVGVKQPLPPPVLAEVRHHLAPIPPSQVADPRPGPAKSSQYGQSTYQHLHVPVNMMEDFLRLAQKNTAKNLETCGVLAGSLKNRVFHITTLIIPKQEATSDSCQTLNEEEIFEVQDKLSLFPLGWIHTHPTQTCFMSSVDLHTHYSYQIMLPEAVAIVMAPTDTSCSHGIFHLSDPGGVNLIRNCQERGFHPHEEPEDGSSIYEHCSHVYINARMHFDVIDLR
ncbi:hypothetical protein MLD38_023589 [Melastoma candidum]|uniref:Uncharacterized protein n=1 Tax=Melastoma candidum TaxID=119954 RepID=A0ACB9NQL6_9MYRT|nr:hypothetical protein MLD38_023589 [Melastoma candidum]